MVASFQSVLDRAVANKGGMSALEALLPRPLPAGELAAIPDDRWLSMMTKRIFQSGFVWSVVEAKWDGFEAAFEGFEPRRVAMFNDEDLDRLVSDAAIIRNGAKIRSATENARFLVDLADENGGSAAKVFADWPDADYIDLLEMMKKRGSRLGGNTGQYVLRSMGKPAFVLSKDVVAALIREGVVEKPPTSKKAVTATRDAFNQWSQETGRDLSALSRILAASV
jgi:3-methyladenine DNA glycosylase Tag